MRSPAFTILRAMLWELWRVTRVEIAFRLVLGAIGGLTVLAVFAAFEPNGPGQRQGIKDFGAVVAQILLVVPHFVGWVFLSRLNKGRPGFPFHLLYTRPVRTEVMVGLPLAYLTAVPMAIYLVSALLLRVASGYPFPLLPVAAWIAALNVVQTAVGWSMRNMVILTLTSMPVPMFWLLFADYRLNDFIRDGLDWNDSPRQWPAIFDFPLTDYPLIALIGLVSFAMVVARVARQRHGDVRAAGPRRLSGMLRWLEDRLGSCPTSSATRAQLWFELRSGGIGLLAIGLAIAGLTPLVYLVTAPVEWLRQFAIIWTMLSVGAALFVGTISGLGIRFQGGLKRSEFEATLPVGSARLAGLKGIVRSVCLLAVLIALGASIWGSVSYFAVGKGYGFLRSWIPVIEVAVRALTGYEQVALAVVALIGFVALGAWHPAFWVVLTRYPGGTILAALLLLLYGLALALLALAVRLGTASQFQLDFILGTSRWIVAAALVLATAYLFWSGFTERLLTLRYVAGALLVSLIFGVAWVMLLRAAGLQLSGMPTVDVVWKLAPVLLPLTGSLLAPWSLNRIRHT